MILKNISAYFVFFGFRKVKLNMLLWQSIPELLRKIIYSDDEYEQIRVLFDENPALKSDNLWGPIGSHLTAENILDGFAKMISGIATRLGIVYLKQVKTFV